MRPRRLTLLEVMVAALGDYGPTFRRRLKSQLPRGLWRDVAGKKGPVPAAGTPEWDQLRRAPWISQARAPGWPKKRSCAGQRWW